MFSLLNSSECKDVWYICFIRSFNYLIIYLITLLKIGIHRLVLMFIYYKIYVILYQTQALTSIYYLTKPIL